MKRRLPPAAVLSALFLLCASCGREPAPEAPAGGTAEQLAARIVELEAEAAAASARAAALAEEARATRAALAALRAAGGEPASAPAAPAAEAPAPEPIAVPAPPSIQHSAFSIQHSPSVLPGSALLEEGRASPSAAAVDAIARTPKAGRTISRNPYRGAIAVDAASGRILFSDHPDEPCIPASMVKMMDLLLVQEMIERGEARTNDMVGVSARAFQTGGSQVYLDPKESFTLEDMLYALMIQSANDAAVAIAEHVAGSCEAMVERMNARAAELGMRDTRFRSVHGLPPDAGGLHDVSTPRDMAILARELCRHPDIFRYTGTDFRVFRPAPRLFEMRTHNPVLQPGSRIAGADGLKTGYTKAAGYSLAVSVLRNGRRVIVVTMGTGVPAPQGDLDSKASKSVRNRTISSLVEQAFSALEE